MGYSDKGLALSHQENDDTRLLYIIANSIAPYGLEAATVLSLVKGAQFRARFPSKWIAQNVRENLDAIAQSQGIYIFRNFETGQLIPVRYIQIDRVRIHGDVYLFEYTVGDYIQYDDSVDHRTQQITKFNETFLNEHKSILQRTSGGEHLAPLVFASAFDFDFRRHSAGSVKFYDSETASWMATVDEIAKHNIFEDYSFFKIADISEIDSNKEIKLAKRLINLLSAKIYEIKLICYTPFTSKAFHGTKSDEAPRSSNYLPRGAIRFKLEIDNSLIFPLLKEATATGQYDIVRLRFKVASPRQSVTTMLGISVSSGNLPDSNRYFGYEIPAHIKANKSLWIITAFILAAFGFIYIFPSSITTWINSLDARTLRDISMIVLTITIIDILNEIRTWFRGRQ